MALHRSTPLRRSRWVVVALVAQILPLPGHASEKATGFYGTLGIGGQWPLDLPYDTTFNIVNTVAPALDPNPSGTIDVGGAFSGEVGLGYDFGTVRTELTYVYGQGSYEGASNSSFPDNNNATNTYYKNDIFASVYIDFENQSSWTPYVGGGIGFTSLTAPQIPTTNGDPVNLFGYQAKVGVAYTLNPRSQLFVEGVYQGTPGFTASNSNGSTRFGAFNSFGTKLGLRLRF